MQTVDKQSSFFLSGIDNYLEGKTGTASLMPRKSEVAVCISNSCIILSISLR